MPHRTKGSGGAWRCGGGTDTGDGRKQRGVPGSCEWHPSFYVSML